MTVYASNLKGGGGVFARVTQYDVSPERLQQGRRAVEDHVVPALRMQSGYSGLLLGNPESGKMISVSLWETEQAMHDTDEAAYWFRTFGAEEAGGTVADVDIYGVYRARLTHSQP
jgi:hypothetical protein